MTELIINGQRVRVSEDFLSLSPEMQEQTVEDIAASLSSQQDGPALSQLNLGIADAVGGFIDLVNPFDTPAVSQALGTGDQLTTGSARDAMVSGMQSTGMAGEDRSPDGLGEAVLRGSGQAAGALPIATTGAQALSAASGLTGRVSGELARGLSTRGAVAVEIAAGGASGAGMQAADDAGLPDWAVGLAGVAAPMGLAGAMYGATQAPQYLPGVTLARRGVEAATATVAPYTRRGAEAVARNRMQELVGSRERAIELGERINPNDEFGLTPAQQTGDASMLSLEQAAASNDPLIRERLDQQFADGMAAARGAIDGIGGDVGDAQSFLRERRAQYTQDMRSVASQALRNAEERLQGIQANRTEGDNSLVVMEEVARARDIARARETELWEQVPRGAQVGTENARAALATINQDTGQARANSVPEVAQRLLGENGTFQDRETVLEMHDLYSELREVARNAMAGTNVQRRLAANANTLADAILEDLGAVDATTEIGRRINDARMFSSALHETFDRGAYGRLSRRTIDGDTATDPELALERSVGRGGTTGDVSARQLEAAGAGLTDAGSPAQPNREVGSAIADFIRGRFTDRAFTPDSSGTNVLNRRRAQQFIRANRVLMERYPELRREILQAADQQQTADQLATTIARRIEALENARTSPTAGFIDATQENAIRALVDAEDPLRAAQLIRNGLRGDPTGAALDGVKAAFSDDLTRRATRTQNGQTFLDADAMLNRLQEPRFRGAMNRILEPAEIRRLERIMETVQRLNQSQTSQRALPGNSLSGARAPRAIEFMIRIAGAPRPPIARPWPQVVQAWASRPLRWAPVRHGTCWAA